MNVQDIQIGDWVQNPLGAPYQVLAIHFYRINGDGDGYYGIHLKNKGAEARIEIYDLHPVPLTPEILEKNGFIYQDENVWGKKKEEITTYLAFGKYAIINHNGFLCIGGNAEIHYVHELQHALRLCGIDKEIVV